MTPLLPLGVEFLVFLIVRKLLLCFLNLQEVFFIEGSLFQRLKSFSLSYEYFLAYCRVSFETIGFETPPTMLALLSPIVDGSQVLVQCVSVEFTCEPLPFMFESLFGGKSWALSLTRTQSNARVVPTAHLFQ